MAKNQNDQHKTRTAAAATVFYLLFISVCGFVDLSLDIAQSFFKIEWRTERWSREEGTRLSRRARDKREAKEMVGDQKSATQVKHCMMCLLLSLRLWMCDSFLFAWWQLCNKKLNRNHHHHQLKLAHCAIARNCTRFGGCVSVRVCFSIGLFACLFICLLASVPERNFFGAVTTLCRCVCVCMLVCVCAHKDP